MLGYFHVELMLLAAIYTFASNSGLAEEMVAAKVFAGHNTTERVL